MENIFKGKLLEWIVVNSCYVANECDNCEITVKRFRKINKNLNRF